MQQNMIIIEDHMEHEMLLENEEIGDRFVKKL